MKVVPHDLYTFDLPPTWPVTEDSPLIPGSVALLKADPFQSRTRQKTDTSARKTLLQQRPVSCVPLRLREVGLGTMNSVEEELSGHRDFSRPYFQRQRGEVGLYFDLEEVECEDVHAYGSEQLMRMDIVEKLGHYLAGCDLVKVKVEMMKKGHFHGVILEEFRKGTTLAVTFNQIADLVSLWKLHEGKELSSLFQTVLVDGAMLKEMKLRKLKLRVRTWQDELEACREELREMAKEHQRVDINDRPRDVAILQNVRRFQREQNDTQLQQLRDAETNFERHLSEFLFVAKQHLPPHLTTLPTLQAFQDIMATAAANSGPRPSHDFRHVQEFFSTLDLLRSSLAQAELSMYLPLMSVPARCETENQRDLKRRMMATGEELRGLLEPGGSLKVVWCRDWDSKVLLRERAVFLGLVSVIPLALEKITDLDQQVDEYMSGFPSVL